MYPLIRFASAILRQSRAPKLGLLDTHVSQHICWPWDIDPFMELNNGRTLTLYDLGRFGLFARLGMLAKLKEKRWAGTVAGSSVRYRRRVRMFDRFEMHTRILGWDSRFIYLEQGMYRKGEYTSHVLIRTAITDANGLVPTKIVSEYCLDGLSSPALPDWVTAWTEAEAQRPWPPELHPDTAALPTPKIAA